MAVVQRKVLPQAPEACDLNEKPPAQPVDRYFLRSLMSPLMVRIVTGTPSG